MGAKTVRELLAKKAPATGMSAEHMPMQQRVAFSDDDDNDEVDHQPKKTIKLNNNTSTIPKNIPKQEDFRKNIQKILDEEEEEKRVGYELTQKFLGIMRDQTLDEAKDSRYREYEKSVVRDLIDFARIINSSPAKEDDLGTMSVLIAICRAMLTERDRLNQIEYENHNLKKEMANMMQRLAKLTESK